MLDIPMYLFITGIFAFDPPAGLLFSNRSLHIMSYTHEPIWWTEHLKNSDIHDMIRDMLWYHAMWWEVIWSDVNMMW